MDLRYVYSLILTLLIAAQCVCIVIARKSRKEIGRSVAWLDAAFIPPMIGNLILIGVHTKEAAMIGSYIYFIGMDIVMLAFMNFASAYCKGAGQETKHKIPFLNFILLGGDALQLALNTVFGHAFDLEPVEDGGMIYYRLVPYWGQTIHRIIDYGIFLAIVLIFNVCSSTANQLHSAA